MAEQQPNSSSTNHQNPNYRQYNPYQDVTLNPQFIKLYNLPTSPEHLFEDQANRNHRSWGENLTFFTGISYASGAVLGGANGFAAGISAAEPGDSVKIRVSRVLNSAGSSGRKLGNSCGVLGLIYGGLDSLVSHRFGFDDVVGSVIAGLGTGAVYRVANGVRSAAVAGVVGGVVAGVAAAGKHVVKRYVPI